MKLICCDTSPFSRKAVLAAEVLGVSLDYEKVNPYADPSVLIARNPTSKVPVLILADEETIIGSDRICHYLNEYARGSLFAKRLDGRERLGRMGRGFFASALEGDAKVVDPHATIRQHERLMEMANAAIESAIAIALERKREALINEKLIDRHLSKLKRVLGEIETKVNLLDLKLTMTEITIISLLGYLDLRVPALEWQSDYPLLSVWYDNVLSENPFVMDSDHKMLTRSI